MGRQGGQGAVPDPTVVLGEGVLALLDELHGGEGCLVLLEDLHWADADTLGLLAYLADAAPGAPVLLGLTARDDVRTPAVAELAARPAVTTLELTRLDPSEVAVLAAARRGGRPLGDAELAAADGPLGGAAVPRRGTRRRRLRGCVVAGAAHPGRAGGGAPGRPARSRPAGARRRGGGARRPRLAAARHRRGHAETLVLDALRAAAEVGLLDDDDGERLRWRHALTRDAVLTTVLPPERASVAGRAAAALDRRSGPGDRSTAAELYLIAGDRERATAMLVGLGRHDAERGALRGAAELLARAAATGWFPTRVAAERVRVLTMLGRIDDALAVGVAVLVTGAVTGDEHAQLCLQLARTAVAGGRWAAAEAWLERAGRPADPRSAVLAAEVAFGAGDAVRGGRPARAAAAETALDAGPQNASLLCEALMILGRSTVGADLVVSAAAFRRAAQVAAEHALTPRRVEALFGLGAIEVTGGNPTSAALMQARGLAEQCGMLAHAVQADIVRCDASILVHGPHEALMLAEATAERAGRLRQTPLQAMAELAAAAAAATGGDQGRMMFFLDAAASRADAPAEVAALTPVLRALPHLMNHDLPRAAALVDEGIRALLPHGSAAPIAYFGLWPLLRTAVADRGDEARVVARRHHSFSALANQAAVAYAEAIAHGRAGRAATAMAFFAEADAAMAATPWWNRLLRSVVLGAAVLDGWGDPVPALRADLAAHETTGAQALARTCRDLLRAAGAPTRRGRGTAQPPPALRRVGITSRGADVLALVVDGLTNAQIAGRLFLSPRTVETHVARLLAKTGTTGRSQLRAWMAGAGTHQT